MRRSTYYLLAALFALLTCSSQARAQSSAILDDLRAQRAKYGTPMTEEERGKLLNDTALMQSPATDGGVSWGLLLKTTGANCPQPVSGIRIACDILVYRPTAVFYDVIIDGEGQGLIPETLPPAQPLTDASRFIVPAGDAPQPPRPPADELAALTARVAALERGLTQAVADISALADTVSRVDATATQAIGRVSALESIVKSMTCRATLGGFIGVSCQIVTTR